MGQISIHYPKPKLLHSVEARKPAKERLENQPLNHKLPGCGELKDSLLNALLHYCHTGE